MPGQQLFEVRKQNVTESIGRMQQYFLNDAVTFRDRDAPECGTGVDGKDHLVSWYTLSAA